ncbi:glycosyltransferase [Candidatus Aminicenantes bacterium AC-335-K20]|jgi:glycosyltransferase involved in cell wall biosynthesis|nr:glycosyltransferase [SCandidatus Aminicenantes bacterium Aminicenantia_JdfR_composite]MCP2596402.1 glycosyltransferase [Candidatus Aminicenantes bacterium AC-335-G13]MCP2598736.1 glycosyltransferase [Candidatus Aminicenantes bacterium AC-335-L06]MCP2606203.1 glycosyltransferase [Candidatus Aminicenantes bacterium AC-708-I09]MCP2618220.1 glycosyltransferase [Candidatus Aminicenantes bacterium AC-335-A11]MCP2619480.1 glycosyltransferase [Candidatus Aminicenantes bacterium AC-335-K20]MCP26211
MKENNFLIETAKYLPGRLPSLIKKYYRNYGIESTNRILPSVVFNLINNNEFEKIQKILPDITNIVSKFSGIQYAYNLLSRIEVIFGLRKPKIGIYDHTFHLIGGGQKYGCTVAYALQEECDVTLIANKEVSLEDLKSWYDLDLSKCEIKVIKIPFYEERGFREIDPGVITFRMENPFHIISRESGNYDIFINNSMLEMVYPLSNISILICHFPERRRANYFYVDKYNYIIYNSKYTREWIKKKWGVNPTNHIYPPVDMICDERKPQKENIILSVARFEIGGSKQQLEMIKAFKNLRETYPEELKEWKLVLAGGSIKENPYLNKIENFLSSVKVNNIELKVNIPIEEIKNLYKKAKIFWHFCGLNQTDPSMIEHFGMSIVEAMQNWCVPVVFDGGGQKEIVEEGVSGYRFSNLRELKSKTMRLIKNENLLNKFSEGAFLRGKLFTKEIFISKIKNLFNKILISYTRV